VYGSGGTNKTFVWTTLLSCLRGQGKIMLVIASSGIASLLLLGGRTAHSRFKKIFGGKTVVLGGDFQQILLVVPKGGREDIVSASLPRSHLWQPVTILRLHINMRIMATNSKEQQEFAKWVLNVGDDNLPAIAEEEGVDPDWIKIPSHMRLLAEDCSLRGLI
jgi:hypothetical protein